MDFLETIKSKYRVVETRYGNGESEITIPLGSWRKGGGLAGSKGHVYLYGSGWAGVWLIGRASRVVELAKSFPAMRVMQKGNGETTFRVPLSDLDRLLPLIAGKKRTVKSKAQLEAAKKGQSALANWKLARSSRLRKPIVGQISTRR